MKKSFTFSMLCALIALYGNAQIPVFGWQAAWGATEFDRQAAIVTDHENNIYVAGQFTGSIDFDPGSGITMLNAGFNTFSYLSKFDPDGNLQWVRQIGTVLHTTTDVAFDPAGYIVLHGRFFGATDFDPGPGVFTL